MTRKTLILLGVGLSVVLAIALLTHLGLTVLSSVRAYVGGEGLWSKGQKDAVNWLHRYAETRDEAAYGSYLAAVAVPLGDRMAREELQKPHPDENVVARGFIQGRNHPADVKNMARLFRDFHGVGYMRRAVSIWERGDAEIARLVAAGDRLHAAIRSGASGAGIAPILAEIDAVNTRVTPLEDRFSFTLGEAARWAKGLVLDVVVGAAVILFLIGAFAVRRLIREIGASEQRYRTVTETATDGILSIDDRGRIVFANTAAARLFGYPVEELVGADLTSLIPERLRDEQGSTLARYLAEGGTREPSPPVRLQAVHRDGHEIPLEVSFGQSWSGRRRVFTGIIRDITRRMQAEQQIERLAYQDTLTGLPNRVLFHDRLNQSIARARRDEERVAVMFLDLDDFKLINDSLGHARGGDAVLREIGQRLIQCLRAQDTAARVGGDEFILLLPDADDAGALAQVAEKILEAIARPIALEGQSLCVTGSIGISVFPDDGVEPETLLRNADIAMYRAKELGANAFEFFTSEMNDLLLARHGVEQALYRALENRELLLHYQPIWRTGDEHVSGVEALLRWNHPTRGRLLPNEFVPLAESSPVMLAVGDWVLRTACEQFRSWIGEGLDLERVSVNLSARQFQQRNLEETVGSLLTRSAIAPERFHLEITETAATRNADLTIRTLLGLRRRGVRILMDDFGSGHASIGYLRRFPVDALKIDWHFIDRIDSSPSDAAMVRAIIEMAHGLGLSVVAEGVSRAAQLDFLRDHGCDEFQGHLFAAAMPPDAVADLIASRNG